MTAPNSPDKASRTSGASAPDRIGPHGREAPPSHDSVEGGGSDGTPAVNLDDDEIYSGRGKSLRAGGTANAKGGDSGRLGPPAEQLSGSNGPSDPDQLPKTGRGPA